MVPIVGQIVKFISSSLFPNIVFSNNFHLISRDKMRKLLRNVGVRNTLLNKILESETPCTICSLHNWPGISGN